MDKIREYKHLVRFKEKLPFFPDGEICISEEPDFIVHTKGTNELLGIEHTEFYQDDSSGRNSLQAQHSIRQKVVQRANRLYLQNHNKSPFVQVSFNSKIMIYPNDLDHLSTDILHLVESTSIKPGKLIILKRTKDISENFPQEINKICIYPSPTGKKDEWHFIDPGWIPDINSVSIQERINKKEPKLEKYKCYTVWLLIVADESSISPTVDYEESAATHIYSTGFDRVFFFWNSSRHLIEFNHIPLGHKS